EVFAHLAQAAVHLHGGDRPVAHGGAPTPCPLTLRFMVGRRHRPTNHGGDTMRLLLTNDDGIAADGLAALEAAARPRGELTVAPPLHVCSGCGHRVTTGTPLRVEEHGPGRFAVDGTPADCVRVALHALGGGFDFVLSGINAGGNLGADVFHSGTVA